MVVARKIGALFFAVLLMASNVNLTMATHYCGGKAVINQLQLGPTDLSCGMVMDEAETPCKNHEQVPQSFDKTPCCANSFHTIDVDHEFSQSSSAVPAAQELAVAFTAVVMHTFAFSFEDKPQFQFYFPPPPDEDLRVLFQVFRI